MRITTDRKAALADASNRQEARRQVIRRDADLLAEMTPDEREANLSQWIDDVINDWVDELKHDLESGAINL